MIDRWVLALSGLFVVLVVIWLLVMKSNKKRKSQQDDRQIKTWLEYVGVGGVVVLIILLLIGIVPGLLYWFYLDDKYQKYVIETTSKH